MRSIGKLEDRSQAQRLSDFLYAHAIGNELREADDGWALWVLDDAHLAAAREHLAEFRSEPDAPRYDEQARSGREHKKQVAAKDAAHRRRLERSRRSLYGADGRGWLTMGLMAASLIVAVVSQLGAHLEPIQALFLTTQPAAMLLPEVRSGQIWRLFTPIIVHFGAMHLGFNLFMWWSFGQAVEIRKGFAFTAGLVLSAAVFSNLAQYGWQLTTAPHRLGLVGGLSGVLYALFGYAWIKGRLDPADNLAIDDSTTTTLMIWLVVCMTGIVGSVANGAHVGGLVWGGLYGLAEIGLFRWQNRRKLP